MEKVAKGTIKSSLQIRRCTLYIIFICTTPALTQLLSIGNQKNVFYHSQTVDRSAAWSYPVGGHGTTRELVQHGKFLEGVLFAPPLLVNNLTDDVRDGLINYKMFARGKNKQLGVFS